MVDSTERSALGEQTLAKGSVMAPSRRRLFALSGLAAAGVLGMCGADTPLTSTVNTVAHPKHLPLDQPTADEAWRTLVEGNARFAQERPTHPHQDPAWRKSLVSQQHPFACVLGCIDSRVPPELVFDQGLGDLLTVRSAGEVLDETILGSVEYGVEHLGIPLVVVLGHANCGAVQSAISVVRGTAQVRGEVSAVVRAIEATVRATPADLDDNAFLAACVAEQSRRSAALLLERSPLIADAVAQHGVRVVAATYDLVSGRVLRLS